LAVDVVVVVVFPTGILQTPLGALKGGRGTCFSFQSPSHVKLISLKLPTAALMLPIQLLVPPCHFSCGLKSNPISTLPVCRHYDHEAL